VGWSTLPFLPLFIFGATSDLSRLPHSSRFAPRGNLTFRVMGGKGGKITARNGNDLARWAAKTARFGAVAGGFARSTLPGVGLRAGVVGVFARDMRLFKVLAARGGSAVIELNYHEQDGKSSWEPNPLPLPWEGRGSRARRVAVGEGSDRRGLVVS
jgi:hypothetical protein